MRRAFVGVTLSYALAFFVALPAAQAPAIDLTGTWKGTGTDFWVNRSVADGMNVTWVLTQTGSLVTGTITSAPLDPNDGSCSSCHRGKTGTITGSVSGGALSVVMDFPGRAGEITPHCAVNFTGTAAAIAGMTFTTLYTGVDSCEGPFTNGTLTMTRQNVTAPSITMQPSNTTATFGSGMASFMVAATGDPAPTYQWELSTNSGATWTALANAGNYFDVTTNRLQIAGAGPAFNGYQYRAIASNVAGSVASNAATLTVVAPLVMKVTPASLAFGATSSGGTIQTVSATQTITVGFTGGSGGGTAWTAVSNQPWLQVTGGAGSTAGTFTAQVLSGSVPAGSTSLSATLTVVAKNAVNSTISVPVTLQVTAASSAPFGSFDSPAAGASVEGAIAVTGWALDDTGVSRVEIWRDKVAGETTPGFAGGGPRNGRVFIADAFFVNGARPDIEAIYPAVPYGYRAGWGYLLLTQGLWNQGNGSYTLYAFAFDQDGLSATLGSKVITGNNATAIKPFGAIDTPAYGQTVSASLWNFGWALTPNATPPCTIGPSGVQVAIDSGPLMPVSYGDLRPDIAAAFPGFTNTNGASGAYYLDTTTLTNGTHQIGWFVTDNCGRSEGIGSRFFTVLNGSSTVPLAARPTTTAADAARAIIDQPVVVRRALEAVPVEATADGNHLVTIRRDERIEVELPSTSGASYVGYQIVNGTRRALPQGSSLDGAAGVFYWQPAAGFLGTFQLEFVPATGGVVRVQVTVAPPGR
jgi:hypothetical protein